MYKAFLGLILLAPLPFGANRPVAWSFYAVLVALFGISFFVAILLGRIELRVDSRLVKCGICLFVMPIIWSVVQLLNWVPQAWVHPFWQMSIQELPNASKAYISLAPGDTGTALMRLLSYGLVFFISMHFNRRAEIADYTFKSLAFAGLLFAVYGLVIYFGRFNTILWFDKLSYRDLVTSTFVNRNSYATYAGITLLASFPLLFEKIQASFRFGFDSHLSRQYFFEKFLIGAWMPLMIIAIISTALLLTQSRGGFLSSVLALVAFFLILILSRKIKHNVGVILLTVLISLGSWLVFQYSGDRLIDRLDEISLANNDRLIVYDQISRAIDDNPWLGAGYGSFEKSFRLYRDQTIVSFFDKAHNTYLENIFELGVIQAWALFLSILLMVLVCVKGVWIRRKNWIYPAVGIAASVLVGTHALVDFSLQIPAVALTYALILGAAVAQSRSSRPLKN